MLCDQVQDLAYAAQRDKAQHIEGVHRHALGGTDTHVHLAVQTEPFVTISTLVQELNGACAHEVNRRLGHRALVWQRGYGVVSFGRKNLPWIIDDIARQREYHAVGRMHGRMETFAPARSGFEKPG